MFTAADLEAALKAQDNARSLQLLAELHLNQSWNWDLLIRIPNFWTQSKEIAQSAYDLVLTLGNRGVDLQAFVQSALNKLRFHGTSRAVPYANRFLRHGLERWRCIPGWQRLDWSPY